jgi:glycosyltransferase involved in cell wall biosynthesis
MLATIVIPAYNRENTIDRAIGSIANSGLLTNTGAYEIIVVDDASTDKTKEHVKKWCERFPKNIILLEFKDHMERVVALNAGLRTASGEWLMQLDSDDELLSHWKKSFEDMIEKHPKSQLFNWGSLIQWRDKEGHYTRTQVRPTFHPGIDNTGQTNVFKSGDIYSGGFIAHKNIVWRAGFLPEKSNPYSFGEAILGRFKELIPLYTLPDGRIRTDIGNPFGQDFAWYYSLTRIVNPTPIDQILHQQHVRT